MDFIALKYFLFFVFLYYSIQLIYPLWVLSMLLFDLILLSIHRFAWTSIQSESEDVSSLESYQKLPTIFSGVPWTKQSTPSDYWNHV